MAEVKIEKDEIVDFLFDYLEFDELKEAFSGLKEIDFNPFNDDEDEFIGAWQEILHNYDLVREAIIALVKAVERIIVGGVSLSSSQKHDVVVDALDRAIRVPWYAEPFDGPAISMVVNMAVAFMNKIDWGVGDDNWDVTKIELLAEEPSNPGLV